MRVGLTGATGFVGSYILRELDAADHTVRCVMRDPGEPIAIPNDRAERAPGDVTDPASLRGVFDGCDAVIHLVGIIDEKPFKGITFERIHTQGTTNVVNAARASGVQRFIHMSANGAREDGVSGYQQTKWQAEQIVKEAGFEHWTIFRPSIVFGNPGADSTEFATRLARTLVGPFPVLPVFGDGQYRLQPISVEEVAAAFAQALTINPAHEQIYTAVGREAYPYTDVLDRIARGMGRKPKPKVHVPLVLARLGINLLGPLGILPISPAQFEMLVEGNTGDESPFYRDFDLTFHPFTPDNLAYLKG